MAKNPKPEINEDGKLSAASVKALQEWDSDDFIEVARFLMAAWGSEGVMSMSGRKVVMTVVSERQEQMIAALKDNEQWWAEHWYLTQTGNKYQFKDRI